MSWQEKAVRDWIRDVLSAFDTEDHTVKVIFSGQAAPRPAKPYATVLLFGSGAKGDPDVRTTNTAVGDEYKHVITSHRQGTASISIFGDEDLDMMEALELSLNDREVIDANDDRNIIVSHALGINRSSRVPLETSFESRSQRDFVVRWLNVRESTVPAIEHAELNSSN